LVFPLQFGELMKSFEMNRSFLTIVIVAIACLSNVDIATSGGLSKRDCDRLEEMWGSFDVVSHALAVTAEIVYFPHGGRPTDKERHEAVINLVKDSATRKLTDPFSAQFRNVRVVANEQYEVVCGEMNAKNLYGGYVGFVDFVSNIDDNADYIYVHFDDSDDDSDVGEYLILRYCRD
jgi:hypothetical protein